MVKVMAILTVMIMVTVLFHDNGNVMMVLTVMVTLTVIVTVLVKKPHMSVVVVHKLLSI